MASKRRPPRPLPTNISSSIKVPDGMTQEDLGQMIQDLELMQGEDPDAHAIKTYMKGKGFSDKATQELTGLDKDGKYKPLKFDGTPFLQKDGTPFPEDHLDPKPKPKGPK